MGRRNSFVYAAVISGHDEEESTGKAGPGFRGIAKMDLLSKGSEAGQDACCGTITYGPGRCGHELCAIHAERLGDNNGAMAFK